MDQTPGVGERVSLQKNVFVYLEDLWCAENANQVYMPELQGVSISEVLIS